jgi:hypothetical protein
MQRFQYVTTKVLETPALLAPPNGVTLYNSSLIATLAWDCRPGVANAPLNGYKVYIEQKTGSTWSAPTTILVQTATESDTFQNSSLTYTFPAAGTYRWAVQSLGDGAAAVDSPVPDDTKSRQWSEISFSE